MTDSVREIPFCADHLDIMEIRQQERDSLGDGFLQKFKALASTGYSLTMIYDGRIIAVTGVLEMWPGVFQIWLIPSRYVDEYGIIYARIAKRLLTTIETSIPWHRLQTEAYADETHNRWMRYLGFQCEGQMSKYSANQEHYNLWAKVK